MVNYASASKEICKRLLSQTIVKGSLTTPVGIVIKDEMANLNITERKELQVLIDYMVAKGYIVLQTKSLDEVVSASVILTPSGVDLAQS